MIEMKTSLQRVGRTAVALAAVAAIGASAAGIVGGATPAGAQQRPLSENGIRPFAHAPVTFADIVEQVKPAVVSIKVTSNSSSVTNNRNFGRRGPGPGNGSRPFPELPPDHPLNELFKNFPREFRGAPGRGQPRMRRSQGSGFVISADGYVVTNHHVIKGGDEITVSFDEKENLPAKVVGTDPRTDLALLKIQKERTYKYVKFAEGQGRVGDWVVAVGNPFGLGGTVTVGVLSALSRSIGRGPYDFIQIDAAVNRGNSGGPTFNLKGEVIGVNTAIFSPSGGNVGIAFAVPASTAKEVIEQLKSKGSVQRGWLGVRIANLTKDIAESLGIQGTDGALIRDVTEGAPAEKSGLRAGDVIMTVEGEKIENSRDLARKIAAYEPGKTVDVGISRNGASQTIKVMLGTFPSEPQDASPRSRPSDPQVAPRVTALKALGLDLALDVDGRNDSSADVVIRDVDPDSDAAKKGLRGGDVIVAVNGEKVAKPEDVDRIVRSAQQKGRKAVLLTVKRGSDQTFVAVRFQPEP